MPASRSGFSLAMLLLLTAVVAVIVAGYAAALKHLPAARPGFRELGIGIGTVVGLVLGAAMGARHPRRFRGLLLGTATGLAVGIAGGVFMVAPGALPSLALGALLLVAFALVVRAASRPEKG
jgi:hypothetical protein